MDVSCEVIFFFSCSVLTHARHTLSNSKPSRRREEKGGERNTHVSVHRAVVCDAPQHYTALHNTQYTTQYTTQLHYTHVLEYTKSSPTHSLLSPFSRPCTFREKRLHAVARANESIVQVRVAPPPLLQVPAPRPVRQRVLPEHLRTVPIRQWGVCM